LKAVELGIFFLEISIASAIVFQTILIYFSPNHSSIKVFLLNLTGAAKNQVEGSIHLVSNCSGNGSILPNSNTSSF